jgi:hypothetical protein
MLIKLPSWLRHDWVEVKDGVLRQYPVYRCTHCLTKFNYADLKLGTVRKLAYGTTWLSDYEIHKMTPDAAARCLDILDDCNEQMARNIMES